MVFTVSSSSTKLLSLCHSIYNSIVHILNMKCGVERAVSWEMRLREGVFFLFAAFKCQMSICWRIAIERLLCERSF